MEKNNAKAVVPKVIHFCWLSNDPYPVKIRRCMDTWRRVMPDYEVKLWNTSNFDVSSVPYVEEAFKARKWAFAADYIRMYALYTEGGIYLDSDVKVLKPFDEFLHYSFFSSMEYHPSQIERTGAAKLVSPDGHRISDEFVSGIQIQAAVMGAEPGVPFIKEVLEWYADKHFLRSDGTYAMDILSPQIYARIAEKYGYIYKDIDQDLSGNIRIFRSEVFAGNKHEVTNESYAVHYCMHSWGKSLHDRVVRFFKKIRKKPY